MITDEWTHNMRTRCTLGDTKRLKIEGRGRESLGYKRKDKERMRKMVRHERKGSFSRRGKRGEEGV